jgi:hypothetical protein
MKREAVSAGLSRPLLLCAGGGMGSEMLLSLAGDNSGVGSASSTNRVSGASSADAAGSLSFDAVSGSTGVVLGAEPWRLFLATRPQ